jgi:Uma2 family endonuclease
VLLTPARFDIDRTDYLEGPPDVVVEIRSPGDETMEKMPFYAGIGVPEVWMIDRDTKVPELYVLRQGSYERQPAAEDGWLSSQATGIRLRAEAAGKLAIEIAGEPTTRKTIPED